MTISEKFSFTGSTSPAGYYSPARTSLALSSRSGEDGAVVVELDPLHRAGAARCREGRVQAQATQHALVEVLLHDLERPVLVLGVDVHRARIRERVRQLAVRGRAVVHLDRDEDPVPPHEAATPVVPPAAAPVAGAGIFARIMSGMSSIRSATAIPACASRAIFSDAVSSLPSTIVPAWPKLMPGISSMKRPAMKATIGRRELFSVTQRASSASLLPPGSV